MRSLRILTNYACAACSLLFISACSQVEIDDMLLYERENGDFYLKVYFTDSNMDQLTLAIIDSKTFSPRRDPDPLYTFERIKINYTELPLKEVSNECSVTDDIPMEWWKSYYRWDDCTLYTFNEQYALIQYEGNKEESNWSEWSEWQLMFLKSDLESLEGYPGEMNQARILEYADYERYNKYYCFGPLYYITSEGQLQCIYKYENCVYYKQVN